MGKSFFKIVGDGTRYAYSDTFEPSSFLSESMRAGNGPITVCPIAWRTKGNSNPAWVVEMKIVGGPEDGYGDSGWAEAPDDVVLTAGKLDGTSRVGVFKNFPAEGTLFRIKLDAGNNKTLAVGHEFMVAFAG